MSSARRKELEELQRSLGVKFTNLNLLEQALTHTSHTKSTNESSISHYERLEFLGDAVLELVTAEHLFKAYPGLSEGELSKLRSAMVSRESLSHCARKIKIGNHLLIGKDQEGIQSQDALLADAYESIIGALYLDKGLETARHFILGRFMEEEEKIAKIKDFKSQLQEYTQLVYRSLPQYQVIQEIGPDHSKKFRVKVKIEGKVWGEGWGTSKKRAEKIAAQSAWMKVMHGENFNDQRLRGKRSRGRDSHP
ncbi:MAG: ribonuclease III [bacterium]